MSPRRYASLAIPLVAVAALQVGLSSSGMAYCLTQLTMSAYYSLVVVGLCLLMGYAGQISLGHAGFFAIGGYATAFLTTLDLGPGAGAAWGRLLESLGMIVRRQDVYGKAFVSVAPWAALIAATVVTLAVAFLIGIPVIRLRGHYLAMATLGFGVIVYRIALATSALGGADGISDVPAFSLLPGVVVSGKPAFRIMNYYVAWVLVILSMFLSMNLIDSRVGRALRSIHGNEEAANALGVNTSRYKLHTFVLSALYASVAGFFLTHYNGGIGPSEASVIKSVRYVAIVAAGGMDNLWGVLVVGTVLNYLSLRGYFGSYDDAVFAVILILVMLFAPRGFLRAGALKAILMPGRKGAN